MRARKRRSSAFLNDADKHAPLEVCIFNVGANVNFPILDTTERVFRKVWEMACYSGFLAGREAARLMLPRGKGNIFFTGATASLRGGIGLCGVRQRQVRPARGGAGDGARTGAEEHPCRASRSSIPASTPHGCAQRRIEALGPGGAGQSRSADAAVVGRGVLLAALPAAAAAPGRSSWKSARSARSGSGFQQCCRCFVRPHCEERSDEAIQLVLRVAGLLTWGWSVSISHLPYFAIRGSSRFDDLVCLPDQTHIRSSREATAPGFRLRREGSRGRDHSSLRHLKPCNPSVRPPGSAEADRASADWLWFGCSAWWQDCVVTSLSLRRRASSPLPRSRRHA